MAIPRPKIKIFAWFLIAILSGLTLILLYLLTYRQINHSLKISQNLAHSTDIQLEVKKLISELQNAEAAQRGFLLTTDSSYLRPLKSSKQNIDASIRALTFLIGDDEVQQNNLDFLHTELDKRFDLLIINLRNKENTIPVSTDFRKRLDQGHALMNSALLISDRMINHEDIFLEDMRREHYESIVITPLIYFSIVAISLAIFLLLLLKVNSDRKKLRKTISDITVINHSFEQAEKLAGLGVWSHNFKDGTNSFSDNYFNLLKIDRGANGTGIRQFLTMVLEPDRAKVFDALKDAFRHYKPFEVNYRILAHDGSIRHIKSTGKTIIDADRQRYLIGINMDVSEPVHQNNLLKLKNDSLELFNADLASFNYVASHDVQALLRKLQLFISRIIENEGNNLSQISNEYLQKMNNSSRQMAVLINDLLVFSRTSTGKKNFELSNLNEVLKNAVDELSDPINVSNAHLKFDVLPLIAVIPGQIHRLFVNLINNSIKFAKKGIDPEIRITYNIVEKSIIDPDGAPVNEKFHLITFTDNGIGFENEYSQKIFHLLFRIHNKSIYPGSGIGLAICKKIVENHSGFIEAESVPDQGTTFKIFLPVNKINSPIPHFTSIMAVGETAMTGN